MAEFNYSGSGPKTVYLSGEYNERTGQWEGNYPVEGIDWQMDERSGRMYAPDPYYVAPSKITPEDIKNRVPFSYDPYEGALVVDPNANVPTDPNEYSKKLGTELSKRSYDIWSINGDASQYRNLIEGLKEVDPKAYYTAKIDTLSRGIGHQYQSNQMDRGDVVKKELEALLPEAQKAGVTPDEINSLYGSGYSSGAQGFSQILRNMQEQGGNLKPLVEGLKVVGPAIVGAGVLSSLAAANAAAAAAGAGAGAAGAASTIPAWLSAAGQGALVGGALGGTNAALQGGDIGKGLLTGAVTGAVGGGAGNAFGGGTIGNIAGGTLAGGAGAAIRGGNIGQGALLGGVGGAINAGINSLSNSGTSLFNTDTPINVDTTGTTKMDELFGPSYADLGYNPYVGPTYQELGYDPYANLNIGDVEAQQGGAYGGPGYGYQPENPYTNMSDAELTQVLANTPAFIQSGGDLSSASSLLKQLGSGAIKALLGGGSATGAARVGGSLGGALGGLFGGGNSTLGNLVGAAGNYALSASQLSQLRGAYDQSVAGQQAATQTAQQQAAFTPVGMTTTFGSSNFQYDPATGKMISAGYTPSSAVSGIQQALLGQAGTTAQQAAAMQQQTAPLAAGAQNLFGLANRFLPTSAEAPQATAESQALYNRLNTLSNQVLPTSYDTTAAAQKYMQQQQNLLNPGRAQTLAQLQTRQYGTGTSGLATGGTAAGYAPNAQGLMATNPQMAAYYNAMAQQDAQLAANAEQQARANLQSDITMGTGLGTTGLNALTTSQQQQYANMMNNLSAGTNLYGAGAGLLGQTQSLQTGAYAPLTTQVGLLGGLESLAQQPLSLATSLGTAGATAGAKSGYYGLLGNQAALATQLQGQQANIYGTGQAVGSAVSPFLTAGSNIISEWLKG